MCVCGTGLGGGALGEIKRNKNVKTHFARENSGFNQ